MSTTQFTKKPITITASQWFKNGDHPEDYAKDEHGFEGGEPRVFTGAERKANAWEGGVVRYYRHPDVPGESLCEQCGKPHHVHGWIDTLEQGHRVCPGDWIITGIKGERYPCKPDIFAATYDPAALTQGAGAVEPVAWASPKQLENLTDPQYDDHGRYLPVRKTSAGLFTAPLYAAPPAQQLQQAVARAVEECAALIETTPEWRAPGWTSTICPITTKAIAAAIRSKGTHD